MSDGVPPPLPPKQQGGVTVFFSSVGNNNGATPRYSAEEAARALQEESQAYELIKQQKKGQQHGTASLRLDVTRSSSAGPCDWNKPWSNSLISSSSANNISIPRTPHLQSTTSSSAHTSGATTPVNSTPMSSSPVTPGMTQEQDLMSFKSPEKTNNDQLINMLQNLNANSQRGGVVAIVPNAATPLGGMMSTPSMMGPSYPQHQNFGASSALRSNSFNIPGRPTTVNHLTSSMTPGLMNTSLNLNSNMMSVPAPPLPHRNPVIDPKRMSILANQMYPNQNLTSPLPYSANGPNSNVRSLKSGPPNAFNFLSLNSNHSFFQPSIPYTPNIPLNIPTFENVSGTSNLPRLPLSSTPSSSPSVSSISSQPPIVLTRYTPVKQKKTLKKSEDLIDFGSSPTRDSRASHRGDVNSVLFEFDPIIHQEKSPGKARDEHQPSPQKSISNDGSVNDGAVALSREASEMLRYKGHCTSSSIADDQGSSYYEQVDPFEYMRPDGSCRSDPVYDAYDGLRSPTGVTGDTFDVPPPLPPRASTPVDGSWEGVAPPQQPVVELRKNANRARADGTVSTGTRG